MANPKSKRQEIKEKLDEQFSQLKEDLGNLNERVEELEEHGGSGDLSGVVRCLNDIKGIIGYLWTPFPNEVAALMSQLTTHIAELVDTPEETITIDYDGTTAVISGLASTNINYSGTTAIIGG